MSTITKPKEEISQIKSIGLKKELYTTLKIKELVDLVGLLLQLEDFKD
jgi:hypothetical protein